MAMIDIVSCREVFLELQKKALCILQRRGLQGTSHSRSLVNAREIKVMRERRRITICWHNAKLDSENSTLTFRWNDKISRWLRENVLYPQREMSKRQRFAERRLAREEKRAREAKAMELDLANLARELCTSVAPLRQDLTPPNAAA